MTKQCSKCKGEFDLSFFYAGHGRICKPCKSQTTFTTKRTEQGKLNCKVAKRAWKERNPLRYKAQTTCYNAIRDKKIFKEPCQICGEKKVQAHHDDYSKPLDVMWLCPKHHKTWHKVFVPNTQESHVQ